MAVSLTEFTEFWKAKTNSIIEKFENEIDNKLISGDFIQTENLIEIILSDRMSNEAFSTLKLKYLKEGWGDVELKYNVKDGYWIQLIIK